MITPKTLYVIPKSLYYAINVFCIVAMFNIVVQSILFVHENRQKLTALLKGIA